jgi:hypothetical protein
LKLHLRAREASEVDKAKPKTETISNTEESRKNRLLKIVFRWREQQGEEKKPQS